MTYTEIYEAVYGQDKKPGDLDLTGVEMAAWKILRKLGGRKGFDHWWSDVEENDCADEIFHEIQQCIATSI